MAAERLFGIRALGMRRFVQWALAVIVLCAALLESPLGQRLEAEFGLRWLYQIRGPLPSPPDTVLVTMDDAAANTLGETIGVEDWPRTLHACLIERLAAMHAAVIVMDVNFESAVRNDPPPDAYSAPVRKSCTLRNGSAGTEQLGAVIAQAGNVLLASYLGQRNDAGVQMVWERMPTAEVAYGALGIAPSPLPERGERFRSFVTFHTAIGGGSRDESEIASLAAMAAQAFEQDGMTKILADPRFAPLDPKVTKSSTAGTDGHGGLRKLMSALRHRVQINAADSAAVIAASPRLGALYRGVTTPYFNIYGAPGALDQIPYSMLLDDSNTASTQARIRGKIVFVGAAAGPGSVNGAS